MLNKETASYPFAKVGKPAPDFKLLSTKNLDTLEETIELKDYRGKWLVLFFWPYDFSYVCPTEILGFSDSYNEFKALDCEIVGASVDSVYTHRAWIETPVNQNGIGSVQFPLVSDFTKETAEAYGILDDESGAAHRGLFIIDPEGILKYQVVTDMNVARSTEETLRVLQALQSGGLCPVNWKPGDKTL